MKKKILVIEDEKVLLDILEKKLTSMGFAVDTADNGIDGLNRLKKNHPDLILLDMLLPDLDGMQILEMMQQEKIAIPVIVISNSGQPVDIDKALTLGAVDYLVKANFPIDEIAAKVATCLSAGNKQPVNNKSMREKMLLLVEDDPFLQTLCQKKASTLGYHVEIAGDGDQAIEKIISLRPTLVLLDLVMPGKEGFDVLKIIREHDDKEVAGTPIIILSNLGEKENIEKALSLGANDFLIKANFTTDEIMEKVKEFMGAAN